MSIKVTATDAWGETVRDPKTSYNKRKRLLTISARGYLRRRVVVDFDDEVEVVLLRDPDRCKCPGEEEAGARLIQSKMAYSFVFGRSIGNFAYWPPLYGQKDRLYLPCMPTLKGELERSPHWYSAPDKMHKPPPECGGWKKQGSYKANELSCALQITLYRQRNNWYAEFDIDLHRGLRHVLDALLIHPIMGQPDPRLAAQAVLIQTGMPIGFEMVLP